MNNLEIQEEIVRLRGEEARLIRENTTQSRAELEITQQNLKTLRESAQSRREANQDVATFNKEQIAFVKSFAKLNTDVKKILTDQNNQSSIFKNIGKDIATSKAIQANLTGDELEREIEKEQLMTQINDSILQQAKSLAKTEAEARGLSEFDLMRINLKENQLELTEDELDKLRAGIDLQEKLFKKEERIKAIKEEQKGIFEAMPDSIKNSVGFAQKLGNTLKTAGAGAVVFVLLASVITAAISSFTALDGAAKEFRETTGLTNSQMTGIKSDANEIVGEFGKFGVEAKNVFDTVAGLKSEFGDTAKFSKETVAALTLMNTNFGIATEDATKVQGIMEQVGGLSSETAASVGLQAAEMARVAGVAPAKVMKDIAENAEAASTFFKGDLTALTKNAVQARRMGSSLKDQVTLAEKLLDFEGGIEDELVAATFVSGQFNLSKARALAFEGKTAEAAAETLKQIQRSGDFRKQDFFTQQQLAKASGMTVEEINKQLDTQEKLSKLSTEELTAAEDAIKKGLDITNIDADQLAMETQKFAVQQEQQAVLEQMQNQFMGIVATVGSSLVPFLETIAPILTLAFAPLQMAADVLGTIIGYLKENLDVAVVLGSVYAISYGISKKQAIMDAFKLANEKRLGLLKKANAIIESKGMLKGIAAMAINAAKSVLNVPVVGPLLAAAAAAGAYALGKSYFSKAGDVDSPADGVTRISTKEGGLFELSPNDDFAAGVGISDTLAGAGAGDGEVGGTILNVDFTILSAPLNMMINEIKGLRADMASGKIAVYMDTSKVTSNIGRQVDAGTRNNYSLGQA